MHSRKNSGFTLVEMMIVVAIMAILFAAAIPSLHKYRQNADLKAAAQNIAADIAVLKSRAMSDRLTYRMTFNTGTATYQIGREEAPGSGSFEDIGDPKYVNADAGGCITMTRAAFSGNPGNRLRFNVRGTTNNGRIELENQRGSVATVTINITGRTHISFAMR